MKYLALSGALLLLPTLAQAHRFARPAPGVVVSVDMFYDSLAPYGEWQVVQPYGWVWTPRVAATWRPYTDGQWIYTEAGWTWADDAPWGWAPFHYGRWTLVNARWLWVPGDVWAPAWVCWRSGEGFVGWAPLAPDLDGAYGVRIGLVGGVAEAGVVSVGWSFVASRDLLRPHVTRVVVPRERADYLLHRTRNVTRYERDDERWVNRSLDVREVEHSTGERIQVRPAEMRRVEAARPRVVEAPRVRPAAPRPVEVQRPRVVVPQRRVIAPRRSVVRPR